VSPILNPVSVILLTNGIVPALKISCVFALKTVKPVFLLYEIMFVLTPSKSKPLFNWRLWLNALVNSKPFIELVLPTEPNCVDSELQFKSVKVVIRSCFSDKPLSTYILLVSSLFSIGVLFETIILLQVKSSVDNIIGCFSANPLSTYILLVCSSFSVGAFFVTVIL
jgi:hypothetical protein